jgi:hypothetical protein
MGVGQDHLELVSNSDSGEHVADGAANGTENCVSLLLLQPHSEFECVGLGLLADLLADLNGDVLEPSGEGSQLALHYNLSGLDVDGDSLGNLEFLLSNNELHGGYGDK